MQDGITVVHVKVGGYLDHYSPRIATAFNGDTLLSGHTYLFVSTKGEFRNEYEFMLACKARRDNRNYYMFNVEKRDTLEEYYAEFRKDFHIEYNIVSGEKLPDNLSEIKFACLKRYLMEGLHLYLLLYKRGVGEYTETVENGMTINKAKRPHSFQRGDDWATNVSNVFMGTLIDYYRISSGVKQLDAQISYMRNEQYRIKVYDYIKDVFNSFVQVNKETPVAIMDGETLVLNVLSVLDEYKAR